MRSCLVWQVNLFYRHEDQSSFGHEGFSAKSSGTRVQSSPGAIERERRGGGGGGGRWELVLRVGPTITAQCQVSGR